MRSRPDTLFLLKFLRHGKFSQLRAREVLENFLLHKTEYPQWRENIDMADPDILDVVKTGWVWDASDPDILDTVKTGWVWDASDPDILDIVKTGRVWDYLDSDILDTVKTMLVYGTFLGPKSVCAPGVCHLVGTPVQNMCYGMM